MLIAEVQKNNILTVRNDTFSCAVANSKNHETVKFIFPDNWKDYQKTAVFGGEGIEPFNIFLSNENELCISEEECYIPFEVLKGCHFTLSVFGVADNRLATSTKVVIEVLESGYALGEAPALPMPDVYAQIIDIMNNTKQLANSVRNDADLGMFRGEKGEKGDTGKSGVYYGEDEPTDIMHPVWINPKGVPHGDIVDIAEDISKEVVDAVAEELVYEKVNTATEEILSKLECLKAEIDTLKSESPIIYTGFIYSSEDKYPMPVELNSPEFEYKIYKDGTYEIVGSMTTDALEISVTAGAVFTTSSNQIIDLSLQYIVDALPVSINTARFCGVNLSSNNAIMWVSGCYMTSKQIKYRPFTYIAKNASSFSSGINIRFYACGRWEEKEITNG